MKSKKKYSFLTIMFFGLVSHANAAVFEFGVYGGNGNISLGGNVYSDYRSFGIGLVEIDDAALVPNAFIDMKSTDFLSFDLNFVGRVGTYSFTFGQNALEQDFLADSILPTQTGITLDSNGIPLRFDSPQYSVSNSQGVYNTSGGAAPDSQTESFVWFVNDRFDNPAKVLLEDTMINGIQRFAGDFLSGVDMGGLPANTQLGDVNGTWDFFAPLFDSNEVPFKGFYTFDTQVIYPSAVPLPATAWLFGSGLIGLIGAARRKRTT